MKKGGKEGGEYHTCTMYISIPGLGRETSLTFTGRGISSMSSVTAVQHHTTLHYIPCMVYRFCKCYLYTGTSIYRYMYMYIYRRTGVKCVV